MKDINLSNYKLIQPSYIRKIKKETIMYDITVKDDHTFFVYLDENNKVLCHNCDGHHIATLIISFFYKWFPQIIEKKKLYRLVTPLVVCDHNKERKYFYTLNEFLEFSNENKVTNITYLKGLGSLSPEDWENIMKNKLLFSIVNDRSADKFLEIIFGDSSLKRKKWLEGK